MENKKQSSVEWLVEQISYQMDIRIENTTIGCDLFEQAKARHEWEIYYALDAGYEIAIESKKFKHIQSSAQYYYETFGGSNEN